MSDEIKPVVNTTDPQIEGSKVVETETPVVDEHVTKVTHQRVLSESKQYKSRAIVAETELKSITDEALKIQQNHEERANRFQEELTNVKAEKSALLKRVSLEPALVAAGCVDAVTALQIGDRKLLQEDGGELSGVDEFVADLKANKPYLFTVTTPSSVNAQVPRGGIKTPDQKLDAANLDEAQIMSELHKLEAMGVR